ncbi:MAG: hypothetical protein IJA20_02790 [Methanocorpusculum sp.]|nr:hypothetical protein [Methanocorpusculum sp.]
MGFAYGETVIVYNEPTDIEQEGRFIADSPELVHRYAVLREADGHIYVDRFKHCEKVTDKTGTTTQPNDKPKGDSKINPASCPWCGSDSVYFFLDEVNTENTRVTCMSCNTKLIAKDALKKWDNLREVLYKKQIEMVIDAAKEVASVIKAKQQLVTGQPVLVRDRDTEEWRYNLFSHKQKKYPNYVCVGSHWVYCIPYEGNEHLLGTTDDSPAAHIQEVEPEVPLMRPDYVEQHKKLVDAIIREPYHGKPEACCCNDAVTYKLKPCPWCGETTCLSFRYKFGDHTVVQCGTCHNSVKAMDAARAWNDLPRKENTNE